MGPFGFGRRNGGERGCPPSSEGARLARRLETYPPYIAPHRGDPARIDGDAARENLAHFESALPVRLSALAELLADEDVVPAVDPANAEPEPLVARLHDWSARTWPALGASGSGWREGERDGDGIAFSLALDVAALLGELVRRGRPSWRWDVDVDPEHGRAGVETFHRVVLRAPFVPDPSRHVELDIERVVIDRLLHPEHADQRHGTPWWRAVRSGIDGSQAGANIA